MMRDAPPLRHRRVSRCRYPFRGTAAWRRRSLADLTAEPLGDLQRERGLAGPGGPDDRDRPHGISGVPPSDEIADTVGGAARQFPAASAVPVARPASTW